jgi:PST family polysaccharide transporter
MKILFKEKGILRNTSYLSIIEVVRLSMPFVALPYIYRTVGVDNYGAIVFAQAVITYFTIFIDFGLDISAVRDISINRDSKQKLSEIVSSIFIIKLLLLFCSFIILALLLLSIPSFNQYLIVFVFAFLTCISDAILPIWYFQGIEKMKDIAVVRLMAMLFYIGMLFTFVKGKNDYILIPLFQSVGLIISAILAVGILIRREKIRFYIPTRDVIFRYFMESVPFFSSRVSVVVNSTLAKIVSGFFFTMHDVAAFDLAQKVAAAAFVPLQMFNQAVFPHNAKNRNSKFARDLFNAMVVISLVLAAFVFIMAPWVIHFFSKNRMPESIILLRLLCVYIFSGGISLYTGSPVLVAFGYARPFNVSVIISTLVLVTLYVVFYLLGFFSIHMFALSLGLAELTIAAYRLYFCFKYSIFKYGKHL